MSKSSFSRHLLAIEMDLPAEMYTLRGLVTIAQSQKKGDPTRGFSPSFWGVRILDALGVP